MGNVYRRAGKWWISYYKDGRRYRESSGSEKKTHALRFLKGREGQVVEGRFNGLESERIRYEDLETDFLNDYEINDRKSQSLIQFNLRRLSGYFQGMKAKNITADRVRAYVASRKQEKTHYDRAPSNATINRDLSALKRMFNLAMQAAKIDRVPHIEKLEENNVRHGFFNHHEYLQLRKELPDYLLPVVAFAYYTGMRRGEILSLRWAQINFADGTVRLEPGTTKNKEPRVVALAPDLFEEIVRQKKLRG